MKFRSPIVTVLGHVDHGKTTLLDAIRKTNVAAKEAGGITQGIGASQIVTKEGKTITFIDTPGHAAFTSMRSRGVSVCDIALLVVDASDGVKPQTLEALNLITETKLPYIVVVSKIDLPAANTEGVLGELTKKGVLFEGRGGDVPYVLVSAKEGRGVEKLLETISLLAEVSEVYGDNAAPLEAVVIETMKGKSGPLVTAVIRKGMLIVGSIVYSDELEVKVRGLTDYLGKPREKLFPGDPVAILGFSQLPLVGSVITSEKNRRTGEGAQIKSKDQYKKVGDDEVAILLKAKNTGAVETLLASMPPKIVVVNASIGDVLESDVLLAKAAGARIVAFESLVSNSVLKLAEMDKVTIEKFEVIYELIDRLKEILTIGKEEIAGKADIIAQFPFNNKRIAGCKVLQGIFLRNDKLILFREEKELGRSVASSLRKQKQEITQAKAGEEFGVLFEPQLDFQIGDVLVSVGK